MTQRHIAQAQLIGNDAQRKIEHARILIVGVGALGSVTSELLCRAGVRNLTLCDYDIIEESNLQRQALYTTTDIGRLKVEAAKEKLIAIDPLCLISIHAEPFSNKISLEHIDMIIDGTDSLYARLLLNDAARKRDIPLIIGTASGSTGMVFSVSGSPCWQCITKGKTATDDCDTGVLNTTTHVVASMQAKLAFDCIIGKKKSELLHIDFTDMSIRKFEVSPLASCAACQGTFAYLDAPFSMQYCAGRQKLQAKPTQPIAIDLLKIKETYEVLSSYENAVLLRIGAGTALVHSYGAVEFSNVEENVARAFVNTLLGSRS